MTTETSYHGNPNLKPVGYEIEFTADQIKEIMKCQDDYIYFIETYCHIVTLDHGLKLFKLYEFQKKKIHIILGNRKVVLMEPRQQGKTIVAAACILWYTLFQERKTVAILANKGAAAREVLDRYQIMYEHLPMWLQQGVKTWNKGDIELENGSKVLTAATTISGIRGKSVNWLYIDEAAIIPNNVADQFFASVYPTISAGETTKILLTSTPLGYNHFWKFWNEAEKTDTPGTPGPNGFISHFIPYWEHPDRTEAWANEQLRTLGELKFNQEVLCNFLGSSNTLINGRTLGNLSSMDPVWSSEDGTVNVHEKPLMGLQYVVVADVARGVGADYSACTVIDITQSPYRVVAKYRDNHISPLLFPGILLKLANDYNKAFILVETNDLGQQIVDILYSELEYENVLSTVSENGRVIVSPGFAKTTSLGVRTTKSVKRLGCFALKSMMEEQKLLVFDANIISELSTFVEKNGTFAADEGQGYNDDLVMTLVLFGWLTTCQYFRDMTDVNIREKMYQQQMDQIDSELTPFGIITDGTEGDDSFVANNTLWTSTDPGGAPWRDEIESLRGGNT